MKKFILICLIPIMNIAQTAVEPSAGDGTANNPYQISSLENLYWIAEQSTRWNQHYIQTEDIDASETKTWFPDESGGYYGWYPIGDYYGGSFTGSYNGDKHTINELFINRTGSDYQGLFGSTSSSVIKNLGLINISVSGRHYTGGLVGYNNYNSIIINCYSIGTVTGSWHVGGLVADNNGGSQIIGCYTSGYVQGTPMVGGLAGSNQSSLISDSYSRCNVSGSLYEIGGLVGLMVYSATISNCYSTGTLTGPDFYLGGIIGRIYDCPPPIGCFWDIQTSGMTSSAGGTGKTTAEMKTQTTFTNSGWDFINTWEMIESYYPRLISNPDSGLPVELISFYASIETKNVTLTWQTATEVNNYGFDIERSLAVPDPIRKWMQIGFIKGNLTTTELSNYFFCDADLEPGRYQYRLKQIDLDGAVKYSNIIEVEITKPYEFVLAHNYPNPFNPVTRILYQLPNDLSVTIKILDILGNEIVTLVNEDKKAGSHEVNWNAENLTSGIYLCRMQAGNFDKTEKMILMK